MDNLRLLVCGSRDFTNKAKIEEVLRSFPEEAIELLIHGNARGADKIAALIGMNLWGDDRVKAFPADWNTYGRTAGFARNKQMLVEGKPNLILAFFSNVKGSRGTADMVYQALGWESVRSIWCWDEAVQQQFYAAKHCQYPTCVEDLTE